MAEHRAGIVAIIVLTLVAMLVMFLMNGLNNGDIAPGLYQHGDMEELSERYYIEITPTGATFSIWGAIYLWQVLFIAYGLSTICRQSPEGYLYCSPKIMPVGVYLSYLVNCCLNASWLVLFDREIMPAALAVIVLMWVTLLIPLVLSHLAVHNNVATMQKYGMMKEIWLVRFLVQNAHAFYCTWITVATLLNLAIVLTYDAGVEMSTACTVSLAILATEIAVWLVLDFIVLRSYTQYLFSPYIVLPIALGGSLAKNFDIDNRNTIITIALLGLSLLAAVIKVLLMVCAYRRRDTAKAIDNTDEKKHIPA